MFLCFLNIKFHDLGSVSIYGRFLGHLGCVYIEGDLLRIRNPWDSLPCITTICDDMFGVNRTGVIHVPYICTLYVHT